MTATGTSGELRVGYQLAAVLGRWSLTVVPALPATRFEVDARILRRDQFWITQPPFEVVLVFNRFSWHWVVDRIQVKDSKVTFIVAGKPEVRREGQQAHG